MLVTERLDEVEVTEAGLDPSLIDELADIVKEAGSAAKLTENEIASWFYFVPCVGVRSAVLHLPGKAVTHPDLRRRKPVYNSRPAYP